MSAQTATSNKEDLRRPNPAAGRYGLGSVRLLGQWNLFTGELEPIAVSEGKVPEQGWLFDPDWGLVLPENPKGREILVDQGVSVAFPAGISDAGQRLIFGLLPEHLPEPPSVCKSADSAQLILSGFGIFLGKKSERLTVKLNNKTAYEFPLFRISEVVVASRGVSLSSDLIKELCERGIRLSFVEPSGRPYAMISSPILNATVESRREQLLAFNDARGLEFARLIVRGKIRNQRHLLLYFGKYLKQSDPGRFASIAETAKKLRALELQARKVEGSTVEEKRQELMGLEGVSGRLYWQGVKEIVESKVEFMGRVHQGAADALNALLNYGYGILYTHVWGAVVNAGLEPFAGFLHVDRPGKPSLVLDLVEEFRQPVVDRTVIASINLGQTIGMKDGLLDQGTRQLIGQKVLERLTSPEPFRGQQYQIRSIIQMQARALVSFLRNKGKYKPFSFRW
ncbi:MAG: CRISPR-associated endonuclease Cas1 [Acidobacteria bacterium]|nr:CRISPR-associated endonuclease Cas1 [Acidobacteriota bacterium]